MQENLFNDVVDGVCGGLERELAVFVFRWDGGQFFACVGHRIDFQRGIGGFDGDRRVDMIREDGAIAGSDAFVACERIGEACVFSAADDDHEELVGLIDRFVRRRTDGDSRELTVDGDCHVIRAERLLILEERRYDL